MRKLVKPLACRSIRKSSTSRIIRWLSSSSCSLQDVICDLAVEAHTSTVSKSIKSAAMQRKRAKIASKAHKSALDFYNFYHDAYGEARWPKLGEALLGPSPTAALTNPFVVKANVKQLLRDKAVHDNEQVAVDRVPWAAQDINVYWINNGAIRLEPPSQVVEETDNLQHADIEGDVKNSRLMDYYCLDPSSLLPVMALGLSHLDEGPTAVLDMCAAPGGKALAILQALSSKSELMNGIVVLNEYSDARRKRLRRVLDQHLPKGLVGTHVFVTGRNGISFGNITGDISYGVQQTPYSHVLCDVPCSGERHMIQDGRALGDWKIGISRKNQKRQVALLKAAVSGCAPGGTIVYSTCSIAPEENDGIVEKILSKRKTLVDLVPDLSFGIGEPTKYGWIVLPDHPSCAWLGPMYIAKLRRKKN